MVRRSENICLCRVSTVVPFALARLLKFDSNSSTHVGPGKTEFTVTLLPLGQLGTATRDRQLGSLREPVVDHFFRDEDPRLAGDEDHPSPSLLQHFGKVMPG